MTTPTAAAERAALARSDRYIREFVEALHLCPYAKRCRESGKLHRRVVLREEDGLEAVRAVEALPEEAVEVALLIFPNAAANGLPSAHAFEAFCTGLREQVARAHEGAPPFYCVAFHPDLPRDLEGAHRAVQFIRRSPDPTLQLVRASVLRAVRGTDDGGTRLIDPSALSLEQLMAISSPLSLADRIAEANLAMLQREGPDAIDALLASLRAPEA